MQFQLLAEENCGRFRSEEVKKLVTGCPHCVNTFRHEYLDFLGGHRMEVLHHSELFSSLLGSGALKLKIGAESGRKVTYHDPCYLGRYEGVFNEPRSLIEVTIIETPKNRSRSYCCGGGAAGFTLEAEGEKRVDQERKDQIAATGVDLLITSCPECNMMLAGAVEETRDIAELLLEAVE
jgi:Fe-S oxidoreductase